MSLVDCRDVTDAGDPRKPGRGLSLDNSSSRDSLLTAIVVVEEHDALDDIFCENLAVSAVHHPFAEIERGADGFTAVAVARLFRDLDYGGLDWPTRHSRDSRCLARIGGGEKRKKHHSHYRNCDEAVEGLTETGLEEGIFLVILLGAVVVMFCVSHLKLL